MNPLDYDNHKLPPTRDYDIICAFFPLTFCNLPNWCFHHLLDFCDFPFSSSIQPHETIAMLEHSILGQPESVVPSHGLLANFRISSQSL